MDTDRSTHVEPSLELFTDEHISRLQRCYDCSRFPGAMPQAVAYRTVGAESNANQIAQNLINRTIRVFPSLQLWLNWQTFSFRSF